MADENDKAGSQGTRRFRLPKLFAEADGEVAEGFTEDAREAGGPELNDSAPSAPQAAPQALYRSAAGGLAASSSGHAATDAGTTSEEILEYVAGMAQELLVLREKITGVADAVSEMSARESTQEKVFDTLHAELSDYKKDFIYEHLKPVVRPLLFLYDSLEQFDGEIAQYERPQTEERRGLSPALVRENVIFFREQLVEALRVVEVEQMERPEGIFNPKQQKAVGVESVGPERDNTIVKVVRSGWFLNGQLLRPAEVVVGKASR